MRRMGCPFDARWPPVALWALTWAALLALDGRLDLANLALLHVAGLVLAALWGPAPLALVAVAASVLAFNIAFVPPRGRLAVDLAQHAVLLGGMLATGATVALLAARLRGAAARARRHAQQGEQLRRLADALRDAGDPLAEVPRVRAELAAVAGAPVQGLLCPGALPAHDDEAAVVFFGNPDAEVRAGLWLGLRGGSAFGPGTGRHDHLPAWVLPMRAGGVARGAAWVPAPGDHPGQRAQAQALCDLMGQALQRAATDAAARAASEQAQAQSLRYALLAAIAHDLRTPLAALLGAATSLRDQDQRLAPAQRRRLVDALADEAEQLHRRAENTLQMARLGTPGLVLRADWESLEEIVGSVLERQRRRHPQAPLQARVEPALPLLRVDAALIAQLLDNLVDNALAHAPGGPVEILARREGDRLLLAVRDRGPGVAPGDRARLFEPFERGPAADGTRGAGLGLALCRAIADAHGAMLTLRPRAHGGSAFELRLPVGEGKP